jgi:hypothetical protein
MNLQGALIFQMEASWKYGGVWPVERFQNIPMLHPSMFSLTVKTKKFMKIRSLPSVREPTTFRVQAKRIERNCTSILRYSEGLIKS